jgi:hypothetical protein
MWWLKQKQIKRRAISDKHTPQKREKIIRERQRRDVEAELDVVFSKLVRAKANWKCLICERDYSGNHCDTESERGKIRRKLNNSHYIGRAHKGTRWDYDNCDSICIFCHQRIENEKKNTIKVAGKWFNYEEYKKETLGITRFDLLMLKGTKVTKYNLAELEILLQEFKKELYNYERYDRKYSKSE